MKNQAPSNNMIIGKLLAILNIYILNSLTLKASNFQKNAISLIHCKRFFKQIKKRLSVDFS